MKSRYYKILGLPDNAPIHNVRKQYRKLVMRYHPDKNPSASSQKRFIEIKEAYEILTGKKAAPNQGFIKHSNRGRSKVKPQDSKENIELEMRRRAAEAQKRYRDQQLREKIDNDRYFYRLTKGFRWKIMRISSIVGFALALMMVLDFALPHHYNQDKVEGYHLNSANGIGGKSVSLVKTEKMGFFWVEEISYKLYRGNHEIWVEESWILHNPMRLVTQNKTETIGYNLNFNIFRLSSLFILLFLLPSFVLWYKRQKISFTVLYYFCLYGVNGIMVLYLFSNNRWAHILTFGFL